ncbi:SRPBCC domain-containing protein [Niveibacterium sp. SC-1]|uniref:SRPBCC domain-containing protein n=1 Tax=Niveibacterium sp. SC-1 TaxID=3135646 RepID=UPI00311ED201
MSAIETHLPPDQPVLIMTRVFEAPRELVWAALTTPEHVAEWFGGEGFSNPVCRMDVRPGGLWHHVMRAPGGQEFPVNSVFVEVVEPARLVWKGTEDSAARGGPPNVTNEVTLDSVPGGTRWTLVARFESVAERDRAAAQGYGLIVSQGVERLSACLQRLQQPS